MITLLTVANDLPADTMTSLEDSVIRFADKMIVIQEDGYSVLIEGDYPWGSNGQILNNMILLGVAYKISVMSLILML